MTRGLCVTARYDPGNLKSEAAALQEEGLLEQEDHRKIVIKNKSRLEELSLAE